MTENYKEIFERMLKTGDFRNSSEMAKAMGVTPQAISNYKKKGELAAGFILKFAEAYDVSVDWLLSGEGERSRPRKGENASRLCKVAVVHDVSGERDRPGGRSAEPPGGRDLATLYPDEIIYVGKLLKILRAKDGFAADTLKSSIDALMDVACPRRKPAP